MRSLTQQRQSQAQEALTRSCVASRTILPACRCSSMTCEDDLLRAGVDAVHRLVEQQHVGLLRQRARDEHALLLAAGELADLRVLRWSSMPTRSSRAPTIVAVVLPGPSRPADVRVAAHQRRRRAR